MNGLFAELTIILILAGGIAITTSFLKQPNIIAYIITGLLVGPLGYYSLRQPELLDNLGQIGITLLLFMVGLELNLGQIKKLSNTVLKAGILQILITTGFGFAIAKIFGMPTQSAAFVAIALTFSSTIIVVKLLAEKRDLESLYGKLAVGMFLVQDFVAIGLLVILTSTSGANTGIFSGLPIWQNLLITLIKATILCLLVYWHSTHFFPKVLKFIGKSDELVLIFALAWAMGLAAFVSLPIIGFSLEIGGFLAGLALANSAVHYEIGAKVRSLRDFFIIIFFIVLGSHLAISTSLNLIWPALVFSAFVLIGNPLIVLLILSRLGYKPRTAFLTGVTVGQISEFSLILMALALKLKFVSNSDVSLVTLIGIITIATSSYSILYAEKIADRLKPFLSWFDFGGHEEKWEGLVLSGHIVVVGAHRLGKHIIKSLQDKKAELVVVDHNPEIADDLLSQGLITICGDITDPHIQEIVRLDKARLVISTVPSLADNAALIEAVKNFNPRAKLVITANDEEEASELYRLGVHYALLPHFIGGQHLSRILSHPSLVHSLSDLKKKQLKVLGEI